MQFIGDRTCQNADAIARLTRSFRGLARRELRDVPLAPVRAIGYCELRKVNACCLPPDKGASIVKTIEIIGTVEPGGKLVLQLPADIPAGNHRMVLSIEESAATASDSIPAPSDRVVAAGGPARLQAIESVSARPGLNDFRHIPIKDQEGCVLPI
ncbi:MAG: hypothetical protein AAFY11_14050 [Cyanobacteria bacterium J06641_5]